MIKKQIHLKNHVRLFCTPKNSPLPFTKNGQAGQTCTAEKSSLFAQDDEKTPNFQGFYSVLSSRRDWDFVIFLLEGSKIEGVKRKQFFFWGGIQETTDLIAKSWVKDQFIYDTGSFLAKNPFSEASLLERMWGWWRNIFSIKKKHREEIHLPDLRANFFQPHLVLLICFWLPPIFLLEPTARTNPPRFGLFELIVK